MLKVIAWNIAQRSAAWHFLADSDADVALLQEAREPPADVAAKISCDREPWQCAGGNQQWRAAIVKLSSRAEVRWLKAKPLVEARGGELGVSRPGTLAAAIITPYQGEPFVAVSVYGQWEAPHDLTKGSFIYADASVHRVISDLSVFVGQTEHGVLVAGDLNVLHGHGERGNTYWESRYATVFSGLSFVGPQAPGGRRADPWPDELPRTSNNVPTYHPSARHRRHAPVNWISCSHPAVWRTACGSGRSTSRTNGDQATIAALKLSLSDAAHQSSGKLDAFQASAASG